MIAAQSEMLVMLEIRDLISQLELISMLGNYSQA